MKNRHWLAVIALCIAAAACKEEAAEEDPALSNTSPCQKQPAFLSGTGLDVRRSALSTSEKKIKGLVLIQLSGSDTAARKTWQHPSWQQYGWMGPVTTDDNGNAYTAPVPVINILDNPPDKQNIVYKVNSQTAEMAPFADLPFTNKNATENVFGILGLYFDCYGQVLYAASVASSTREKENGIIYAIDPADGKIKDQLKDIDAMGICVSGISGEKRLYYGSSRRAAVYSVKLDKEGRFSGGTKEELSLDMLGPRGDDKARRIRFDKNGDMMVFGVEFNYNLTAPTEKQETVYRFRYNDAEKKWGFVEK